MSIQQEILQKMEDLERREGVEILLAVESGSRAWGFASPDSDYDVRFIYRRPLDHYLQLSPRPDTLSLPVDEVFDLVGWDLSKVLKALHKSNATLFEWLQSPIRYRERPGFQAQVWALAQSYFNPKAGLHHYLSLAKKSLEAAQIGDQYRLKKLFYVLRPLLSARFIRERLQAPPMVLADLRTALSLPSELEKHLDDLLELKARSDERTLIAKPPVLFAFLQAEIAASEAAFPDIPPRSREIGPLEDFFRQCLKNDQPC